MERYFQEQVARIDRLMEIVRAPDQDSLTGRLQFEDVLIFACQCMWHLRDWILNDPEFRAKDKNGLRDDIHKERCLRICADLANGSKHLVLAHPKTSVSLSDRQGIHLETSKGIFQVKYYVRSSDGSDPYDGVEIREFLNECRTTWQRIIDKHHLSEADL